MKLKEEILIFFYNLILSIRFFVLKKDTKTPSQSAPNFFVIEKNVEKSRKMYFSAEKVANVIEYNVDIMNKSCISY